LGVCGAYREACGAARGVDGAIGATRAEAGCVGIHLYEFLRSGKDFIIHSQWMEEAAFDAHAELPHMKRFLGWRGADYASGAGDEVQEIRLGAVQSEDPGVNPTAGAPARV